MMRTYLPTAYCQLIRAIAFAALFGFYGSAIAEEISLNITPGQQEVYEHSARIERIAIADPAVASVSLMNSRTLLITPKLIGATQLSVWEKKTQAAPTLVINLRVNQSSELERAGLDALHATGLEIRTAGSTFLLDGKISSLEGHAQAVDVLAQEGSKTVDMTASDFDSHVQIDIKVVEVSRQNVMRFGFFLGKNNQDNPTLAISSPGNLSGIESGANGFNFLSNTGFLPTLNAFNLVMGNKGSGLLGTLSILESNGFAYTIAEPSLSAISGQTANFLAGGEFPVPIRSGAGSDGAVTIVFKEYGVRLLLTPTVLDKNRIFMKVSPEVSELDFTNAVQSGGVAVPGLRVRRTDTSISLGDGESFVISGMVSRNTMNNIDKLPGLGSLPIIGAFFQSKRFDRDDKELLMVVTPRLVRPIARDAKLPALPGQEYRDYNPSFSEFFLSNDVMPKPPMGMSN
jgi:pilus assembly protein CpaC